MNLPFLSVDKDGAVVLLTKRWTKNRDTRYISIYGFTGYRYKKQKLLQRVHVRADELTNITAINYAHLWAMTNGVSEYLIVLKDSELPKLFHPKKEYQNELRQTNP